MTREEILELAAQHIQRAGGTDELEHVTLSRRQFVEAAGGTDKSLRIADVQVMYSERVRDDYIRIVPSGHGIDDYKKIEPIPLRWSPPPEPLPFVRGPVYAFDAEVGF